MVNQSFKREVALYKVKRNQHLSEIISIVDVFKASIIHLAKDFVIIQAVGDKSHIQALYESLSEFTILEFGSSGSVGMER